MELTLSSLGTFTNKSGKMMISDPCYEKGTWCQGIVDNVRTGAWVGYVDKSDEGEWGIRCANVYAIHNSFDKEF
jgi:hypothetical protein